ncbi:putative urea ABC transporter substrate-binding protein [Salinisphaera sp. C84B14]|uniref:putative urea ABC transporter substrate-binding protein n=1 Tax=Salinisphaera sp. C84B14 TaxID=1304155 RepID=UPI0033422807
MPRTSRLVSSLAIAACAFMPLGVAQAKDNFRVCWSIYAGWMPWSYAESSGIMDKWADKYDISVDLVQINDYIESVNQYTSGNMDGCAITNMDTLTIPAASGVDSTALIVNDYSDGNDGIILKNADSLKDIEGRQVNLVQFSVSHYFLARALESVGLSERDINTVNTTDADMVGIYANDDVDAVVTWNPQLQAIDAMPNSSLVYTSAEIPREILDMLVVNTQTLEDNPNFGKAMVGAWYEVMQHIADGDEDALAAMAEAAGTDVAGYKQQLGATHLYTDPNAAAELMNSAELLDTMQRIAEFSFDHGLLGPAAPGPDFVGIESPAGTYGNESNVMMRFDPSFTEDYAESR